jgi:hypothetical protein
LLPGRPLIVTDADEVLFHFLEGLEAYMATVGLYFTAASFALSGNIRRAADDVALSRAEVGSLLGDFFAASTGSLRPVESAADSLARLSRTAQIVVFSNLPAGQQADRAAALRRHGMDYPLIVGAGPKGPMLRELAARVAAPVVFIDDIPIHHVSVKAEAPATRCIHFVANRRLSALIQAPECCDHRAESWPEIETAIEAFLRPAP